MHAPDDKNNAAHCMLQGQMKYKQYTDRHYIAFIGYQSQFAGKHNSMADQERVNDYIREFVNPISDKSTSAHVDGVLCEHLQLPSKSRFME